VLVEIALEHRQHELPDAGVELPHEGADADGADDEPAVIRPPRDRARRRPLLQQLAP